MKRQRKDIDYNEEKVTTPSEEPSTKKQNTSVKIEIDPKLSPLPTFDEKKGYFVFKDDATFRPNLSPKV